LKNKNSHKQVTLNRLQSNLAMVTLQVRRKTAEICGKITLLGKRQVKKNWMLLKIK